MVAPESSGDIRYLCTCSGHHSMVNVDRFDNKKHGKKIIITKQTVSIRRRFYRALKRGPSRRALDHQI